MLIDFRLLGRKIVIITVGEERKEYGAHRKFLCHYSLYFRDALRGSEEHTTAALKLPLEDPNVFHISTTGFTLVQSSAKRPTQRVGHIKNFSLDYTFSHKNRNSRPKRSLHRHNRQGC